MPLTFATKEPKSLRVTLSIFLLHFFSCLQLYSWSCYVSMIDIKYHFRLPLLNSLFSVVCSAFRIINKNDVHFQLLFQSFETIAK